MVNLFSISARSRLEVLPLPREALTKPDMNKDTEPLSEMTPSSKQKPPSGRTGKSNSCRPGEHHRLQLEKMEAGRHAALGQKKSQTDLHV